MSWNTMCAKRLSALAVVASLAISTPSVWSDVTSLESTLNRLEALELQVQGLALDSQVITNRSVEPCSVSVPEPTCLVCPGWEGSVDALYLKLHQRGLDFAVSDDGSALTLGSGDVHNLDYDRDLGMRLDFGYRTNTNWALRFGYTTFDTDGVAFAERSGNVGQLFATRSQPNGAEEADTARASATFDYQLFDIIADHPIYTNRFAAFSLFGGLRWIDMEQSVQYEYDGRDFSNGRIIDRTRMDGLGLRFGGEGRWLMAGGFSAFGRMAGGLTYGRYETRFFEDNLDQSIVITDLRDRFDQAVASVDARVGVSYNWKWLTISTGYEMIDWFNLAERAIFVDDIQEATYVPVSQDVLLEGLFVKLAIIH